MKKLLAGCVLGALAMFVWGAAFWMNPLAYSVMQKPTEPGAARQALLEHFPRTGTYLFPDPLADPKQMEAQTKAGPVAMVHFQREGMAPMQPGVFVLGYLHELISVFLAAGLLRLALPSLGCYKARVGFVALLGLTIAFFADISMPIWWHHPWPFHLVSLLYNLGAWVVAGLVLAAFVKPPSPPAVRASSTS